MREELAGSQCAAVWSLQACPLWTACLQVHPGHIVGTLSQLKFLKEPPTLGMEVVSSGWGLPPGTLPCEAKFI